MNRSLLVIAALLSLGSNCGNDNPTKGVWISAGSNEDITAHVEIHNKEPGVVPLLIIPVPTPYRAKDPAPGLLEKPLSEESDKKSR